MSPETSHLRITRRPFKNHTTVKLDRVTTIDQHGKPTLHYQSLAELVEYKPTAYNKEGSYNLTVYHLTRKPYIRAYKDGSQATDAMHYYTRTNPEQVTEYVDHEEREYNAAGANIIVETKARSGRKELPIE